MITRHRTSIVLVMTALVTACSGDDTKPGAGASGAAGAAGSAGATGGSSSGGGSSGGSSSGGNGGSSSGPESFLPLYENGSRLRAVSLGEPGSSSRQLLAWYDTELQAECAFTRAEDGEHRCLPLARSLAPGFADAACTESIWYDTLVQPCTATPPFRVEATSSDSCATYRVYRLTEQALDEVYHEACDGPVQLPAGAVVLGEPVAMPASDFVRGERVERTNDAGFGVVEIAGEDGSREVLSILDGELGTCAPREVADGGVRCVPHHANLDQQWWFADDGCASEPLTYAIRSEGCDSTADPILALEFDIEQVGSPPNVLAIGAAVDGTVYERNFDGSTCTARQSGEVTWSLHPIQGQYDVSGLLAPTITPRGADRLQLPHHAIDGVFLTAPAREGRKLFHDSTKDAPCEAVRSEGGGWVCLADAVLTQGGLYYADADCSEPLALAPGGSQTILATARFNQCVREAWVGTAEEVLDIYAIGEAYAGPVYQGPPESCTPYEPSAPSSFVRLEPAAADDAPALDEQTE